MVSLLKLVELYIADIPQTIHELSVDKLLDYSLRLVNSILPFASGIIIFYLTIGKEKRISKEDVLKKRLENFYIPYYQFYCRKLLSTNELSSFSTETIYELFEFLSKNICNMGTESQTMYYNFYLSFCELLEARKGTTNYFLSTCSKKFETCFTELSNQIFVEYSDICRKLKLPAPSKRLCTRPDFSQPNT